jgi:hypothetical protein
VGWEWDEAWDRASLANEKGFPVGFGVERRDAALSQRPRRGMGEEEGVERSGASGTAIREVGGRFAPLRISRVTLAGGKETRKVRDAQRRRT